MANLEPKRLSASKYKGLDRSKKPQKIRRGKKNVTKQKDDKSEE